MNIVFGHPQHDGCFRFFHGTVIKGGIPNQDCYFEHPIRWWFGLTFGRLFVGVVRTDQTRDVREIPKGDTKAWMWKVLDLPPAEQYRLAFQIAENIGCTISRRDA